jgi:hypothetical protein
VQAWRRVLLQKPVDIEMLNFDEQARLSDSPVK